MNTRSTEIQIRQSNDAINLPTERRYPLDLMRRRAEVYDRYLESNSRMWDIDGAVRWDALDPSRIDAGARASGRVWSWQSWVAFRDIMTCEAALVRACLEPDISADLKFCIATRASERAAAADAGAELAGRLGHYFERPDSPELEALFDTDMVRRMLHEGVDLDALVVAHFAVVPSIDLAVAEARRAATTEDTVADLLGHVIDDLRRQHEWAWTYLSGRLPERDADTRRAIGANLAEVFEHDLLNGARWTSLIDDVLPGAGALAAAESTAATHGLGGGCRSGAIAGSTPRDQRHRRSARRIGRTDRCVRCGRRRPQPLAHPRHAQLPMRRHAPRPHQRAVEVSRFDRVGSDGRSAARCRSKRPGRAHREAI